MTTTAEPPATTRARARARLNRIDRFANRGLTIACAVGAGLVLVAMVEIAYQVINGASAAIRQYGLGFKPLTLASL